MAKHKTVLLVDDDKFALLLMERIIAEAGYKVLKAASGKESLEIAKHDAPDLIIMDIMMPDLDGIATVLKLKALKETKAIPIVICTSVKEHEDELVAQSLGVAGYIRKSPEMKDLITQIEGALQ